MWSIRGWIGGSSCDSYGDRKCVFQQTGIFFGPHCEQMETDLKNPPHGFSPEQAL